MIASLCESYGNITGILVTLVFYFIFVTNVPYDRRADFFLWSSILIGIYTLILVLASYKCKDPINTQIKLIGAGMVRIAAIYFISLF